jgi:hypothetical protein
MKVPVVEFPVAFEDIPGHVKALRDFIAACQANAKIAYEMLVLVRSGCRHEKAQRGYNERDGSWMNPCPHCGASE